MKATAAPRRAWTTTFHRCVARPSFTASYTAPNDIKKKGALHEPSNVQRGRGTSRTLLYEPSTEPDGERLSTGLRRRRDRQRSVGRSHHQHQVGRGVHGFPWPPTLRQNRERHVKSPLSHHVVGVQQQRSRRESDHDELHDRGEEGA